MSVLASDAYTVQGQRELVTTVEVGPYKGVVGTMWSIMREEGSPSQVPLAEASIKNGTGRKKAGKRGQGVEGLWRGWRVGMWGLVGVWGACALGGNSNSGGEF
jgi:fusion and transport protein UGO1